MIYPWRGKWPRIPETTWVAPSADVIGDVEIGEQSSVWFQVVIRGDVHPIRIGSRTNIQDHSVLHVTREKHALRIGDEVTVGHRATLHGCTIGNRVLVGMGAVVLDACEVGDDCIIGAGALLPPGFKVPAGHLALGAPAKVARPLRPEELEFLKKSAANYVGDSREYQSFVRGPARIGASDEDLEFLDHPDHPDHGDT